VVGLVNIDRSIIPQESRSSEPGLLDRPAMTASVQRGNTILSFLTSSEGTIPMFPKYRHTPILDPERKRCPVCHQAVYSLADIHPQCAIKRAAALESRSKVSRLAPWNDGSDTSRE
jgi:hypothetical protein